eukprot:tig00021234_g19412.t1
MSLVRSNSFSSSPSHVGGRVATAAGFVAERLAMKVGKARFKRSVEDVLPGFSSALGVAEFVLESREKVMRRCEGDSDFNPANYCRRVGVDRR